MTAVRSVDGVGGAKADDGTDRAAFLPDAGVCGAMHQAFARQLQHRFLEGANQVQLGEHRAKKLWGGGFPVVIGGR